MGEQTPTPLLQPVVYSCQWHVIYEWSEIKGHKSSFLSRFSDCMGLNSLVKPLSYLLIYQHGNNSYLSRRSLSGGRKLLGYALALRFAPQCISTLNPNFWDLLSTAALDTCITSFDNKGSLWALQWSQQASAALGVLGTTQRSYTPQANLLPWCLSGVFAHHLPSLSFYLGWGF